MSEKILMKGNEALAEAALRAGCRYYSGYPITPQSEILEYLSWRMDEVGGDFIQTESELSGINMLLGAVACGVRGMTTSAGPGFALNQEGISYLCAGDLPCVIVDVQRIGAGLGEIAQGQGDYWAITRGGGNGDYHTIVLAPHTVQETVDLTVLAFDLAEKYRHPVIIGSDAAVGQTMEPVILPEMKDHDINKYDWALRGCRIDEERRLCTDSLNGRIIPGEKAAFTGDYPSYIKAKYDEMYETEQRWESVQTEDAELILVAIGCSARICKQAVMEAREQGLKLGLIRPITIWPFPDKAFADLTDNVKAIMTVEMNILGQMRDDVRLAVEKKPIPVDFYGTYYDVPQTEDIIAKAKELLGK